MFNKSKTVTNNPVPQPPVESIKTSAVVDASQEIQPIAQPQRNNMMDMISSNAAKPSILSEGFSFRGEISAKGAIHVEGSLNGQVQVDELTIGSRGQVEGVVTCSSLHIKGKFSGTATCSELIVTSSASVDGHVVYQTLSVQKGASIKGELLLVK
jgi:cytoskeletal protein CcmA (bactofilin family)